MTRWEGPQGWSRLLDPSEENDGKGRNTQVQYDAAGNRTRTQWPAGASGAGSYFVTYSHDALNRKTEIDANGSPATPLAKYQWDER